MGERKYLFNCKIMLIYFDKANHHKLFTKKFKELISKCYFKSRVKELEINTYEIPTNTKITLIIRSLKCSRIL